jgi:hypothetical protein
MSRSAIALKLNRLLQHTMHRKSVLIAGVPVTAIMFNGNVRVLVDGECCYNVHEAATLIEAYQA